MDLFLIKAIVRAFMV